MPGTVITNSPDVALLDSTIYFESCSGLIYTDLFPTVWIAAGITHVLGAKLEIKNPLGVVVKPYGNTYEIAPALSGGMDAPIIFPIPTISGGFQLGKYIVSVALTDSLGNTYIVSKNVNFCAPDAEKPTLKYASLSAKLIGNCQNGKMSVIVDGVPNYKGVIVEKQINSFVLEYPTSSGLPVLNSAQTNFSVVLFEGVYKITGTICATYNIGDNVSISILYKIKKEHNQRCLIDLCCINDSFSALRAKRNSDCSDKEKNETANTIIDALFLLEDARLAAGCGEDPSDIISELETLLGCTCTCNCNEGTPIINSTPVADSSIIGCGFSKETVGLTTVYTLNNYSYIISIEDNGGVLTIADATLADCTQTQQISFSIPKLYQQIKNSALNDSCTWANIVRRCFTHLDFSCLGIDDATLDTLTFEQIIQALADATCNGGSCQAKLNNVRVGQVAGHLIIKWDEDGYTSSVDIYVNGILVTNVQAGIGSYQYELASLSRVTLQISVIPRCSNNVQGTGETVPFSILGLRFIAPPELYSNYIQNPCPYDITTNVQALPLGVTAEFHTENNTQARSLVPDPTNALQGVYFAFGKDTDGFYSEGAQMQLVCDAAGSCSMPQNLQIAPQIGGNLIKFQSAAYPPPLNSYTVKRRLTSDTDIPANYTTIGTPSWNASISRWVLNDSTAADNVSYTYRAFSNCGTTQPYIDAEYASIVCPTMSLVPKVNQINYAFFPIGGQVDKVETVIYSDNGFTEVHRDTHVPSFGSMVSGSFVYLTQNKDYYIKNIISIGTYQKECPLQLMTTLKSNVTLTIDYVAGIFSAQLDSPLSGALTVRHANVTGSTDMCVTPLQTDTVSPNMVIPAGSIGLSQPKNGLDYHSIYYKVANSVDLGDPGVKVDGDVFSLYGANVTVKINHIICSFYPA